MRILTRMFLAIAFLTGTLAVVMMGCELGLDHDPADDIYTGKSAEEHLSLCDPKKLPESMSDLWVFDSGSFGGMIYYVSFQCASLEDCWQAIDAFEGPDQSDFEDGVDSAFAVNWAGPSFYFEHLNHPQWDLGEVKNGVSFERHFKDRRLDFWAIDRDRLRVYFHHESGGFPIDPPKK